MLLFVYPETGTVFAGTIVPLSAEWRDTAHVGLFPKLGHIPAFYQGDRMAFAWCIHVYTRWMPISRFAAEAVIIVNINRTGDVCTPEAEKHHTLTTRHIGQLQEAGS